MTWFEYILDWDYFVIVAVSIKCAYYYVAMLPSNVCDYKNREFIPNQIPNLLKMLEFILIQLVNN